MVDLSGKMRLRIVTVSNRVVFDRTLTGGECLSSGGHSVPWDGRDSKGKLLSDGVYIMVVEYESGSTHERKLTFLLILR